MQTMKRILVLVVVNTAIALLLTGSALASDAACRGGRSGARRAGEYAGRSPAAGWSVRFVQEQSVEPGQAAGHAVNPVRSRCRAPEPPDGPPTPARRGFEVLVTNFLFIFPRSLGVLPPIERRLQPIPLGGQYMILARKPAGGDGQPRSLEMLCPS